MESTQTNTQTVQSLVTENVKHAVLTASLLINLFVFVAWLTVSLS